MYISSLCFLKFINSHEKIFKSVNNYYLKFTQVDFDSEKLFKNTRSQNIISCVIFFAALYIRCVMTTKTIKIKTQIWQTETSKVFNDGIAEYFQYQSEVRDAQFFVVVIYLACQYFLSYHIFFVFSCLGFFFSLLTNNAFQLVNSQLITSTTFTPHACVRACRLSFVRASTISAATHSPHYSTAFIMRHSGRESCGNRINLTPSQIA